jgi:hypothetical protein
MLYSIYTMYPKSFRLYSSVFSNLLILNMLVGHLHSPIVCVRAMVIVYLVTSLRYCPFLLLLGYFIWRPIPCNCSFIHKHITRTQ